jgi:hypothetical protein
MLIGVSHRHLSNIDCLTARTSCLVCFISTVNGNNKKKEKKAKNVALLGGSSRHITNLKQSIFSSDIYRVSYTRGIREYIDW